MDFLISVPGAQSTQEKITVTSPFNGDHLGSVEAINEESAELALQNAHQLFLQRDSWLPAEKRVEILENCANIMQQRFEELAQVALSEGGKPLVDSRVEVARAIDGIKNCAELLRSEGGKEIPMRLNAGSANRIAFTTKEPIGVVLAYSAFNHPLNLIVHQIAPGIAAGCPVIVKPAADTPLSCFLLVDILHQAGLPKAWCQAVLSTNNTLLESMVSDPRIGFFSFIGSAKVGWMLRSKLAAGTRCGLEHGGAAPAIVAEDADLDKVLPSLAKGGFYHAGQVCVSVQRIYAHQSISEKLCKGLTLIAEALKVGDPSLEETEVGPLIRHNETTRIESWVNEALVEGATLICGGKRISDSLFAPTVLLNPSADSKVSQLEIFGPVVCVYSYDDINQAIKQANSLDVAFQASIYSSNIDTAMHASKHLNASAVMINDHTAFRVDWMPFAGLKHSGHGVGGISYTYEDMCIEKLTVIKSDYL